MGTQLIVRLLIFLLALNTNPSISIKPTNDTRQVVFERYGKEEQAYEREGSFTIEEDDFEYRRREWGWWQEENNGGMSWQEVKQTEEKPTKPEAAEKKEDGKERPSFHTENPQTTESNIGEKKTDESQNPVESPKLDTNKAGEQEPKEEDKGDVKKTEGEKKTDEQQNPVEGPKSDENTTGEAKKPGVEQPGQKDPSSIGENPKKEEDKKKDSEDERHWTLEKDEIIEGDYTLNGKIINLNGHILWIKGNLIGIAGNVKVNRGKLIVDGNYVMRNETRLGQAGSRLELMNEADHVIVKGNMEVASLFLLDQIWQAGSITLGGDFHFIGPEMDKARVSMTQNDAFKFILNGEQDQTIYCEGEEVRLAALRIEGGNNRKIKIKGANKMEKSLIVQSIISNVPVTIQLQEWKEWSYIRQIITYGNLKIEGSCSVPNIRVEQGHLEIEGDIRIGGPVITDEGKISIKGDLKFSDASQIDMRGTEDEIEIGENFIIEGRAKCLCRRGKLIIGKDLIQSGEFGKFETSKIVQVRLLGNTQALTKVKGKHLILGKVKFEKPLEHYSIEAQIGEIE